MPVSQLRRALLALGLTALVPLTAHAQSREVVSKQVSVGRTEASLVLEFSDEDVLEISFDDGEVVVDGDVVGTFEPGGELEAAWRELLGQAVALDDGPLSEMLTDWTAPAELAGELADVAHEIDRALEDALSDARVDVDADAGSVSLSFGDNGSVFRVLLGSLGRLGVLEDALDGLDENVRFHLDENVTVRSGEVVEGTLVVVDGTVRIEGEVDGDVVVVGGELDLRDGGEVTGQARLADSRVVRNEGTVGGGIVDLLEGEREREAALRSELRSEIEEQVRDDLRDELRNITRDDHSFSIMAPFRPVVRAVGGVFETLVSILLLGAIGAAVIAFGGDKLDVIAETAKQSPGRSAIVGIAGTILLFPVWILGTIALAVSIIFIPVAIAWLPLFPLAALAAGIVGYLAVARNAGEWLADSEYPWTGWIRKSNSLVTMVGGLVGLMLAFAAAHVLSALPFVGFFGGILAAAGTIITIVAVQIGFGAVLLTRAGRRRDEWTAADPDAAWAAAMSVEVDEEPAHGSAESEDGGA